MTTILTEAMERAAERQLQRTHRELIGAWRAGYSFLHVVSYQDDPSRRAHIPTDQPYLTGVDGWVYTVTRYDLREAPFDSEVTHFSTTLTT